MIPTAYIQAWTAATPWPDPRQVERMLAKLTRSLTDDIAPLLSADVVYRDAEAQEAFERVMVARRTGQPTWRARATRRQGSTRNRRRLV